MALWKLFVIAVISVGRSRLVIGRFTDEARSGRLRVREDKAMVVGHAVTFVLGVQYPEERSYHQPI